MLIEDVLGENGIIAGKLDSYELRPQQLDMALAIENSIKEEKHLIVEAGTGVGKSMAYLVPLIFYSVRNRKKVIISTYTKALQEQLINKDLPFLRYALRSVHISAPHGDSSPEAGHGQGKKIDFSYALCVGGQNYLCIRRLNQVQMHGHFETRKEAREFQKIIQWEAQTGSGLRSELDFEPSQTLWSRVCRESDLCFGKNCPFKDDCYYNKARRREFKADILVTNHYLFFANLASDGRVLPHFDAIVFDEAQTLEDVATNYLGIDISNFTVKYLLDSILNPKTGKGLITRLSEPSDRKETAIHKRLNEVRKAGNLFFSEIIRKYGKGKTTTRIRKKCTINNCLDTPLSNLSGAINSLLSLAKTEEERLEINAYADRCDKINKDISAVINQELEECVYWAEIEKKPKYGQTTYINTPESIRISGPVDQRNIRCSLFARPISVAGEFRRQIFDKIRPVILTSATLSTNGSFDYIRERLGIPDCIPDRQISTEEMQMRPASLAQANLQGINVVRAGEDICEKIIGSPFNFSENALIYIPLNIPDPNRDPDEHKHSIINHVKDIISITQGRAFVLFTSFNMLDAAYEGIHADISTFTLFKQGDKPRYRLIEEFKVSPKPVLFGTATFWQGVDVPGEALKCVIITRLPFAVPDDPIVEARMELLEARNKNPFMCYQLPHAITLLRQGFGRLIRTSTDTGIVAILDPRIRNRYYGRYFLNSLPDCKKASEIRDIKDFLYRKDPCL